MVLSIGQTAHIEHPNAHSNVHTWAYRLSLLLPPPPPLSPRLLLFHTVQFRIGWSSRCSTLSPCLISVSCVCIRFTKISTGQTRWSLFTSAIFFFCFARFVLFLETWKILVTKIDRFKGCNYSNLCGCVFTVVRWMLIVAVVRFPNSALLFWFIWSPSFSSFFLISYSMQHRHAKSFWISNAPCALLINENERLARNIVLRMGTFSERNEWTRVTASPQYICIYKISKQKRI